MVEFVALGHLRDIGGTVSQQALGDGLYIDRNNLVLLLNELEDADFVARKRDPEDRRRHIVTLTPRGEKALIKAEASFEEVADEALVGLSKADRDELRDLLGKALLGACAAGHAASADAAQAVAGAS